MFSSTLRDCFDTINLETLVFGTLVNTYETGVSQESIVEKC